MLYNTQFYRDQREGSRSSARQIIPVIVELIHPRKVVDVGCGVGTWLAVCKEQGVEEILGIDGQHVNMEMLEIPRECFVATNLEQPLDVRRNFDLVISLEVAEHLPEVCARPFTKSLTQLAPVVLFSAAIPHQGGVGHINEQWPDYWAELFAEVGYVTIDAIRCHVWNNKAVQPWYAQNTFLFARKTHVETSDVLMREYEKTNPGQLSLVHPRLYLHFSEWYVPYQLALHDIVESIPAEIPFILVDDNEWDLQELSAVGRKASPFLERDGQYFGRPETDEIAIQELGRLRVTGAKFFVLARPAFWWLDHYSGFMDYLKSYFSQIKINDRVVIFGLD